MHVGGARHILKALMNQIGKALYEADRLPAAHLLGSLDEFPKFRQVRNVFGRGDKLEVFLPQAFLQRIQFRQARRAGRGLGKVVRQDNRLRLDRQPLMLAKDVELVYRISESVEVRGAVCLRRSSDAEGEATLPL